MNVYIYIQQPSALRPRAFLQTANKVTTKKASRPTKQPEINQNSSPNQRKVVQNLLPEALLEGILGPCWPQKSVLEGYVGLKNRSWRASWGVLGPSWPQEPNKTPKGETMGLQGSPWDPQVGGQVGPKTDQVGTKWRPSWRLCRHVPSSLCPCGSKDPSEPHPRPT